MLYIEYEEYKNKYLNAQREYDKLLFEKEKLFLMTQPKTISFEKDIVCGGIVSNSFDDYLTLKEKKQIDKKLEECRNILNGREVLLEIKRKELARSNDFYDKVYYYKYIENYPVKFIKIKMNYCKSNIYNMLKVINENIKKIKILEKNGKN